MTRLVIVTAASVAALAATFAVAHPQPLPQAGGDRDGQRQERSEQRSESREERTDSREQRHAEWRERRAERMQARLNERLAALRTDMKLRPEQVSLFEAVESVVKRTAEQRRERWAALSEQRSAWRDSDIMEKLDAMSGRLSDRATRTKALADAVRPLWTTLSDEQKTVARRAVREAMAEGRGHMERMRDRWEDRRGGRDRDHDGGSRRWREHRGWDDRG